MDWADMLKRALRHYEAERSTDSLIGLMRLLDGQPAAPDGIIEQAKRAIELAERVDEAPEALAEFRRNIDALIARIDRLPPDTL